MSGQFSLSSLFGRKRVPAADQPETFAVAAPGLALEAFLAGGIIQLRLREGSGRLTDLLNREQGPSFDMVADMAPPGVDDLLIVVPPPQESDRALRLHRPGRPVQIVIGPYEVVGQAHVPPGAQPTGFLLRTNPRFVPLTAATIHATSGSIPDHRVDVAIVNLRAADRFRDVTPEDEH